MQKIKFDFEATKERIYAPNSNVPIGAPVDRNGNIANDGNAYGIVLCKETENEKYWVKYNLVVMVAGYCDIIDAQAIWGDEYSAEAIAAMSDITFCDNHQLPTGGGGGAMVAHILYNEDDNTYSCDKTFEELYAAFPNVLIVTEENGIGGYVMASPMAIEVYVFSPNTDFVSGNLDGITFYAYFIKSDNTVDYYDVSKWFYN